MITNKQCALVTGASSGIGLELARLLAKDGYDLILVARNEQDLNSVSDELSSANNIKVTVIRKDLFERNAAFELYDLLKAKGLKVDILVNDAGQGLYGEFANTDIRRELDIIQLNICSLVVLTKLFLKDMLQRNSGRILNLSSIASKMPGPWQSVYHGTKAFVRSFTEAVGAEIKDSAVSITALLPGATETDFFHKAGMEDAKNIKDKKLADAAEVAKDGYDAMMRGDDMVISGLKNKVQVAMGNLMPDATVASMVDKQQEPSSDE
jgi:short-subunit dehydrogenase